jgi:hypothetical protein
MLARASHAVIFRLNYPKREARKMTRAAVLRAKLRPLLNFHDCEDVRQTCALVLTASGAIYRDKLTLADWIAMFRASRALLRIDRKAHEDATDIATLETFPLIVSEPARFTARRSAIARHIRYQRACIALAFRADQKRQRIHNRCKALRFLRFLASQASATGLGQAEISTAEHLWDTTAAFRRYVATGEAILEREALADVTARNANRRPETLKSFNQLAIAA